MKQLTYTERVYTIAEKMAKAQHHLKYESDRNAVKWEQLTELEKDLLIIQGKASARIAVEEMAEAVGIAILQVYGVAFCDKYLKQHGLIPDDEPEILPMQPGEPGYGGYNPDNPPPDNLKAIDDAINFGDGFLKKAVPDNAQEDGRKVPINEQAAQYADRALKEVINRTGLPTSEIVKQSEIKPQTK